MTEQLMELDQQMKAVLDAICEQQELATREQAAEWLLRGASAAAPKASLAASGLFLSSETRKPVMHS